MYNQSTSLSFFETRLTTLVQRHEALLERENRTDDAWHNGIYERYQYPVLTAAHTPILWRYDLNPDQNPYLMERLGINAILNPGAIYLDGKYYLMCRVEGNDRKSFFAIAESDNGIDGFKFWTHPVNIPDGEEPDTNIYDMRLIQHEDGWIYGLFCTERKDPAAPPGDLSSAVAQCGIARTKDLKTWERLPDLKTPSSQQRNVVLHPHFADGQYALYTRPQDSFIDAGSGGGIGWGLCKDMTNAVIEKESIVDERRYHTIKESKNGAGPAPIKTSAGWLHIAHGVRGTAAGLRYVLYAFLCDLDHPERVICQPGGLLIAPHGKERIGDVSNVVFCNGVALHPNGTLYIYYASSDTRIHVATTTVEKLLDYVTHTPEDGGTSHTSVQQRTALIDRNLDYAQTSSNPLIDRVRSHTIR